MIPIYIISFNNGYYVKNTVNQLERKGIDMKNIHVLDNASTGIETVNLLKELEKRDVHIHRFSENRGHLVWKNADIWDTLSEYFVVTDPDLQFGENLPNDFLDTLKKISDLHQASRVGFALSLEEKDEFYTEVYCQTKNISDWEKQNWEHSLPKYEDIILYNVGIDTTFFLGCKSRFHTQDAVNIRVASNFTARHLPWSRKSNSELGMTRLKEMYSQSLHVSTTGKLIMNGIQQINKRGKSFHVQIDGSSRDSFWLGNYSSWENETFTIFDQYVKPKTIVLDIGAWIGPTVLYLSSLGAKVIAVEADRESINILRNNINLNEFQVNIVEKAIYKDNNGVYFGENLFRNDGMNASTSQIVSEDSTKTKYKTETVTFSELIKDVNIEISLIKVDIEGGEEHILADLLNFCLKNHVPTYISFHLSWWSQEGRNNFSKFQTLFSEFGENVENVIQSPFISLLFNKNENETRKNKVYYGIEGKYTDVTDSVLNKCLKGRVLNIPKSDYQRANLFGDPLIGISKHIKIGDTIYTADQDIFIDYETGKSLDISM